MRWLSLVVALVAVVAGARSARAEPLRILGTDDVRDCALGDAGHVLAATGGGLVVIDPRGKASVLTALEGLPDTRVDRVRVTGVEAELETRAGDARVSLLDLSVKASTPRKSSPAERREPSSETAPDLPAGVTLRALRAHGKRRCLATDHGLFLSNGAERARRLTLPLALPTGDVSALAVEAGRLFIGTFDHGLYVAQGGSLMHVDGGVNANVNALVWDEREAALWVGSARGLWRCRKDSRSVLACRRVGQSVSVHALLLARDGGIWAGTERGLSLFDRTGALRSSFGEKQRAPFRAVWALAESEGSDLFIGTTSGLYWAKTSAFLGSVETPQLARVSLVSGELSDDWVTALLAERETLQVGTYNAGVASFRVENSRLFPLEGDASLGYVNAAGIARLANGELAVLTMDGLRVGAPGNFRTLPTLGRDVTALLASARAGDYWVATRRGLEQKRLER